MKNAKLIKPYYEPVTISLDKLDGIDDLIVKLYEVGFGQYSITSISSLTSMPQKVDALAAALIDVQNYQEHILIYDNDCLIKSDNELRYWFMQALGQIRNEVTVSIASSHHINSSFTRKHKEVFHTSLLSLSYPEWNGLLRIYSEGIGIKFDNEDREYFRDIITGYPPQVIYCADFAKDSGSVEYVKQHPEKVVSFASASATRILESTVPPELLNLSYGFLSFLSAYGSVPYEVLKDVFALDNHYETVYRTLHSLTICRQEGMSGEYVVVNPLVGDYMQRNRIDLPSNIVALLKAKLEDFNANINDPLFVEKEDFESVRYYLKENLKAGQPIPEKYMYSTLYLKAVYELYNRQKYTQVIDMVTNLKDNGAFSRYDMPIQDRIQGYYCRALARQRSEAFYTEVEHFHRRAGTTQNSDYVEYNFLRGFMYRHEGRYDKALDSYNKVLSKRKNHQGTMREIVIVYKGMEDYESAFIYAQLNYEQNPENPFQIQPYFEALVRRPTLTEQENLNLDRMQETLRVLNSRKPISIYYELMAQYALYIEKDETTTRAFLSEGKIKFQDSSFLARTAFNCYESFCDIPNMEQSLKILRQESRTNKSIEPAVAIRQVILDAHRKKPKPIVLSSIDRVTGITEDSKELLRRKVNTILR